MQIASSFVIFTKGFRRLSLVKIRMKQSSTMAGIILGPVYGQYT